jgi:NAD(P)-dependent dehydrogenase (short-subunit alcohol dehydrogenase family)
MGRLAGKAALVTGAGSSGPGWGNGKATAVAFAREGARVACLDLTEAAAAETVRLIADEGGEAIAVAADVTRAEEVARAVALVHERFGRLDVLHNNVGITGKGGPIEESEDSWDRVMDVNVKSMFLTCKHVLPIMIGQGGGAIVNISSLAGIRWTGYAYISYYASKAAVINFTRGVAVQHAREGVRANVILPGLMDTPLVYQQIAGHYGSVAEMVAARDALSPTGRQGSAWDVAWAAVFLASDEARYVNGAVLPVDGGLHCKVGP